MAEQMASSGSALGTTIRIHEEGSDSRDNHESESDDEGPPPPPPGFEDNVAVSRDVLPPPSPGTSRLGRLSISDRPISSTSLHLGRSEQQGSARSDGSAIGVAGMTDLKLLQRLLQTPLPQQQAFGITPFHAAAGTGDEDMLLALLARIPAGTNPTTFLNASDQAGRTPLFFAVLASSKACTELLLRSGANAHHVDMDGRTCGHWAAYLGRPRVLQSLMDAGFQWGVPDKEGRTALHWAAGTEDLKCLQLLLKDRAMVATAINAADSESMTALHWAAFHARAKHLALLIKAGAQLDATDVDGRSALHWTAAGKDTACAKTLLAAGAHLINAVDHKGKTALHVAASEGSLALCGLLLKVSQCQLDARDQDGRTALHWACALDRSDIVTGLVKKGCLDSVADNVGAAPLHYCAQYNKAKCAAALVKRKGAADPLDEQGRSALMWAVSQGHLETTQALLAASAAIDPNVQDTDGRTALHLAAYIGFVAGVRALLRTKGIQIDLPDSSQQTPIFAACDQNQLQVVELLLQASCRLDRPDIEGKTPLHWAAVAGRLELVQSMLDHRTLDINACDARGETALHYACFFGHDTVVQELLDRAGAEANVQDLEGISPLHWAVLRGHEWIAATLLEAQAYPNYMEHNGNKSTPLDYAVSAIEDEALSQRLQERLVAYGGVNYQTMRYLAAIVLQSAVRGRRARRAFSLLRRQDRAAHTITVNLRMVVQRRKYRQQRAAVVRLQAGVRGYQQRQKFIELRQQARASKAHVQHTIHASERAKLQDLQRAAAAKERQQQEEKAADERRKQEAKAAEERRVLEAAKRRGEEARRRVLEEKRLKQEQEDARRKQSVTPLPRGMPAVPSVATAVAGDGMEKEPAALLRARAELLGRLRSRSSMIQQEQRRKREVRVAMRAAICIQRAWRRYKFRKAHPELAARTRGTPLRPNKPATSVAAKAIQRSPVKRQHHLPTLGTKAAPPKRLEPQRPANPLALAREMNRPDYRQRTIAALTVQLWWRRILAQRGRRRRQSLQMQQHEAATYLVQLQKTRVRTIYGANSNNVYQYRPPQVRAAAGRLPTLRLVPRPDKVQLPPLRLEAPQAAAAAGQVQQQLAAEKMRPRQRSAPSLGRFQPVPAINRLVPPYYPSHAPNHLSYA